MNPREFKQEVHKIVEQFGGDRELLHVKLDDLLCRVLCELGFEEGIQEYRAQDVWYA